MSFMIQVKVLKLSNFQDSGLMIHGLHLLWDWIVWYISKDVYASFTITTFQIQKENKTILFDYQNR